MKFPKNERVTEKWLSASGELQFIVTQSLTDPPKFTLYRVHGEEKEKVQTGANPLDFREKYWD